LVEKAGKIQRSFYLPERVDVKIGILAQKARLPKSMLYEAGARILLALASLDEPPDCLVELLRARDYTALLVLKTVAGLGGP
jgi:hypothetical protein